jgi:hypothetical protein
MLGAYPPGEAAARRNSHGQKLAGVPTHNHPFFHQVNPFTFCIDSSNEGMISSIEPPALRGSKRDIHFLIRRAA